MEPLLSRSPPRRWTARWHALCRAKTAWRPHSAALCQMSCGTGCMPCIGSDCSAQHDYWPLTPCTTKSTFQCCYRPGAQIRKRVVAAVAMRTGMAVTSAAAATPLTVAACCTAHSSCIDNGHSVMCASRSLHNPLYWYLLGDQRSTLKALMMKRWLISGCPAVSARPSWRPSRERRPVFTRTQAPYSTGTRYCSCSVLTFHKQTKQVHVSLVAHLYSESRELKLADVLICDGT
jgi:hypothetical protein